MAKRVILFVFPLLFIPSSFPQDKQVVNSYYNERVRVYKYFQDSEGYNRDSGELLNLPAVDFEESYLDRNLFSRIFIFWFKSGLAVYGEASRPVASISFSLQETSRVRLETRLKPTATGTSVEVLRTNSRTDIIFNFATREGRMKWRKTLTDAGLGHLLWPNPEARIGIGKDAELKYYGP